MSDLDAIEILQAKLNCMIKCDIDADIDCANCEYCYAQGTFSEQKEALSIAIRSLSSSQNPN